MGSGHGQRMGSPSWELCSELTAATRAGLPGPECMRRGPQNAQKSRMGLRQVFGWNSVPADITGLHAHILRNKTDGSVQMATCARAQKT